MLADLAGDVRADDASAPFLVFDEGGRVSGSGGCNRLAGTYTASGEQLAFGPLATTRMACLPE